MLVRPDGLAGIGHDAAGNRGRSLERSSSGGTSASCSSQFAAIFRVP